MSFQGRQGGKGNTRRVWGQGRGFFKKEVEFNASNNVEKAIKTRGQKYTLFLETTEVTGDFDELFPQSDELKMGEDRLKQIRKWVRGQRMGMSVKNYFEKFNDIRKKQHFLDCLH